MEYDKDRKKTKRGRYLWNTLYVLTPISLIYTLTSISSYLHPYDYTLTPIPMCLCPYQSIFILVLLCLYSFCCTFICIPQLLYSYTCTRMPKHSITFVVHRVAWCMLRKNRVWYGFKQVILLFSITVRTVDVNDDLRTNAREKKNIV